MGYFSITNKTYLNMFNSNTRRVSSFFLEQIFFIHQFNGLHVQLSKIVKCKINRFLSGQ